MEERLQGAQPPPFLPAPSGSHYTRPRLGGLGGGGLGTQGRAGLGEKGGGKRCGLATGNIPLVPSPSPAPRLRTCEWLALAGRGWRGPGRVLHSTFIPDWPGNLSRFPVRGMGSFSSGERFQELRGFVFIPLNAQRGREEQHRPPSDPVCLRDQTASLGGTRSLRGVWRPSPTPPSGYFGVWAASAVPGFLVPPPSPCPRSP